MHQTVQNLLNIKSQIKSKIDELKYNNYYPRIIAVSKTFPINHIIDTYETNSNTNLSNLKLYRKKPLPSEKKSITSSMNLIIENNDDSENN